MTRRQYKKWREWVADAERALATSSLPAIPPAPRPHRKSDQACILVTQQLLALIRTAEVLEKGGSRVAALAVFDEHSVAVEDGKVRVP